MNEKYLVTPQTSEKIQEQSTLQDGVPQEIKHEHARSYAVASVGGFLGYIAVSITFLVATNLKTITQVIQGSRGADSEIIAQQIGSQIMIYGDLPIVSWTTIALFWGTVGLVVYTLFWLASAFFTAARNELMVETSFTNRGHFQNRIRIPLIKILLLIGIVTTLLLTVKWLGPFWSNLFVVGLYSLSDQVVVGIAEILASIVGVFLNIYAIRSLIVYFKHAEAVF